MFIIVPGFIADTVLRAAYGDKRLSDFERTIRSIVLSVFGLLLYLPVIELVELTSHQFFPHARFPSWMVKPQYLPALGDSSGKTVVTLEATTFLPFLAHTFVTIGAALMWGWFLSIGSVQRLFIQHTGRVTNGTSWQLFWSKFHPVTADASLKRLVTVRLSDGGRIMGEFQSASDPVEDKDLVLGNPWFWDAGRHDWHADNTRFVYISAAKIDSISLSPVGAETAASGYLGDLVAQQNSNRSTEHV
jgi:hypothetical protein